MPRQQMKSKKSSTRGAKRPKRRAATTTTTNSDMSTVNSEIPSPLRVLFTDAQYTLEAHVKAQTEAPFTYMATMQALDRNGVQLADACRVRALAAAWSRHDHPLADGLLCDADKFGVVEVLKAVQLLDTGRRLRLAEKRLAELVERFATRNDMKSAARSRLANKKIEQQKVVNNLKRDIPLTAKVSCSGALSRHIRRWTRTIDAKKLEFFALHLPGETWTQLADIVHLNPESDFPQLPWFLRSCYAPTAAPEGCMVRNCVGMTKDNVAEYVMLYDVPFAHIKSLSPTLTDEAKERIAIYTPELDTLLYDYEMLQCEKVNKVITGRLAKGECSNLPYGKLMERLLILRKLKETPSFYKDLLPHAERQLEELVVPLESPVVVIGDASASMDVAIQTSTIVASFLTALTNADLVFFSSDIIQPKFVPRNVADVIELAIETKTVGSTNNASALLPYYLEKRVVKTFVQCTDEEENQKVNIAGKFYNFMELFKLYHAEVYPARLVFISFLRSQHSKGQMVEPLKKAGFDVTQFRLDSTRPDLAKLNNMIGQLSTGSTGFDMQVSQIEEELRVKGIAKAFDHVAI